MPHLRKVHNLYCHKITHHHCCCCSLQSPRIKKCCITNMEVDDRSTKVLKEREMRESLPFHLIVENDHLQYSIYKDSVAITQRVQPRYKPHLSTTTNSFSLLSNSCYYLSNISNSASHQDQLPSVPSLQQKMIHHTQLRVIQTLLNNQ